MTQEITDRFFLEEILWHLCEYRKSGDITSLDHAMTLSRDIAQEYQHKYPLTKQEREACIKEIGVENGFFESEEELRNAYS